MLPDRWNLRVWLRDWLMRPTAAEQERAESIERSISAAHTVELDPDTGVIVGTRGLENSIAQEFCDRRSGTSRP